MTFEQDDPDLPLLEAIVGGDSGAFEQLYHKHRTYLLVYLLHTLRDKEAAEETLQNLMLAVWRSAGRFRRLSLVRTWMLAIARRQAHKTLRARADLALDESVAAAEDVQAADWQHDQIERMRAALLRLPALEREALELVYYEELTLAQAAERLDIPVNTLKSRLHRARKNLRKWVEL
jgi:RNA polymerase sigma-70 factor (ECF subfamily)